MTATKKKGYGGRFQWDSVHPLQPFLPSSLPHWFRVVCPKPMDLTQNIAKRISTIGGGALIIDYGMDGIVSDSLQVMHIDVCTYNAWIMLLYLCTLMFGKDILA
ncbi:hypothetical protein L6452_29866 [Arctium lappa]|uniref:Uncharacterized protein n=1 Tax=Arctium lappa TaxID=4217 RepID=A0ACB8ZIF9_ARCLA|nr:hypothetical protein L6452_29866 [Arctium lappa]